MLWGHTTKYSSHRLLCFIKQKYSAFLTPCDNIWTILFDFVEVTFMKFNKKSIFQNLISLSYGPLNSIHPYFHPSWTPPHHFRPRMKAAGICCPNKIKNHHFVICRALTSYLSLNFIITNNHTELQYPRVHRFCLLCWSTFYGTIRRYTKCGLI